MRAFVVGNYMNANFLCVERLPRPGESLAASRFFQEHGGKGLNLAVGLQRLGVRVDLLMAVGADGAGAAVKEYLAREGVGIHRVLMLGRTSGFGVGFIAADGSNFLVVHPGANALLTKDHVDEAFGLIAAADWVLAQFESLDPVVLRAFTWARRLGKRTCLNPSPWRRLDERILALTDVLVVNATEAAQLFARSPLADLTREEWVAQLPSLARQLGWGGVMLVITLGDQGSVALDQEGKAWCRPAYNIHQVDATGAGDAFGSGLVWALLRGLDLGKALEIGNACGALIAAREGILDGLPHPPDLEAFLAAAISG